MSMARRHCTVCGVMVPSSTKTARTPARSVISSGCVMILRLTIASIKGCEGVRGATELKSVTRPSASSSFASTGRQRPRRPRCSGTIFEGIANIPGRSSCPTARSRTRTSPM
eukprot:scaffold25817_cov33-Tisochrysis_lutea.AAC.3